MCGIFGWNKTTEVTLGMAPFLAWEMEGRGRESWGMTDGNRRMRSLGPITRNFQEAMARAKDWQQVMFHTRQASTGKVTLENCHPFKVQGDKAQIVGVHNGCLTNHEELNKQYGRNFDCDSMHIFQHLADGKDTGEIRGWGAVAWMEGGAEKIYLSRFSAPDLCVVTLSTGETMFCSTYEPLVKAARMLGVGIKTKWQVEEDVKYSIGEEELVNEGRLEWARQAAYQSQVGRMGVGQSYWQHIHSGNSTVISANRPNDEMDWCLQCRQELIRIDRQVVCGKCYEQIMGAV